MEKGRGKGTDTLQTDNVFTRKEYIEREAALEIAMQYCPDDDGSCSKAGVDLREMLDEIEAVPAADVAPVVRCKDCEYWVTSEEAPCDTGCFLCGMYGGFPSADFFCASGEKRDGDGE